MAQMWLLYHTLIFAGCNILWDLNFAYFCLHYVKGPTLMIHILIFVGGNILVGFKICRFSVHIVSMSVRRLMQYEDA